MAKSVKPAPKSDNFKGFINYNLSQQEKDYLKKQDFSADDALLKLLEYVDDGYRITFTYDNYNRCYQISVLHTDKEHEYAGYCLTARGSTITKAIKQFVYIEETVCERDWGVLLNRNKAMEDYDD